LLLALIHEQSFDDAAAIRGHVATCAECGARSRELSAHDAEIAELLASLDHPLSAMAQAKSSRLWTSSRLRRASLIAGAAATMAAAAAAMVPSSPLHRWIVQQSAPATPAAPRPTPATTPAATQTAPADPMLASGIAIPAPVALIVEFKREQQSGVIEIARTTNGDVTFRSRGGKTAYDVAEGHVSIDNQSPADAYLIDIPAGVRRMRIRIGTRTLIRWPEDSARLVQPTASGRVVVPLQSASATNP